MANSTQRVYGVKCLGKSEMADEGALKRTRKWKRKIKGEVMTNKEMTIAGASRVANRRGFDGEGQADG